MKAQSDELKAIVKEVFDAAEELLKGRPLIRIALEAAEVIVLGPLWDVIFARVTSKGLALPF